MAGDVVFAAAWPAILGIAAVFVLFYLFAPGLAARIGRPLNALGEQTVYAAPILLYVFVVLDRARARDRRAMGALRDAARPVAR